MGTGIIQKASVVKLAIFGGFVAVIAAIVFLNPYKSTAVSGDVLEVNPAFSKYVNSFTAGMISSRSKVQVSFVNSPFDSSNFSTQAQEGLFSFSPSVEGSARWTDDRTLEFTPEQPLPYGQEYEVKLNLSKFLKVPQDLETFEFNFKTLPLNGDLEVYGLSFTEVEGKQLPIVTGAITLSDHLDSTEVENMFKAGQEGNSLPIRWHHFEENRIHRFEIAQVERKKANSSVFIEYSFDQNGASLSDKQEIEIPAEGKFLFLKGKVFHSPEQYVSLSFSDPLDPTQNLSGLITATDLDFSYEIEGNEIKVYPVTRQLGSKLLYIEPTVKNADGQELGTSQNFSAFFEQLKPNVRWVDEGNIVPTENGVFLPFEAVALKAVDVEVVKVFENNMAQFLQVNQIDGSRELARVGREVFRKTVSLRESGVANLSKWNQFNIDLSSIVQQNPGALYRVHISFRMHQALYECAENDTITEQEWTGQDWDHVGSYYYYGYRGYGRYGYQYSERDNPCHITYYYDKGNGVSKNVMCTDIGVIAKKGSYNNVNFVVNNLKTTDPIADARIEVFNLQQQVLKTLVTNENGMVQADLEGVPFIAVVNHQGMRAYLRMDNSSSLSVSHFNTSGSSTQNGLKGFIYGERGVWRPGDSLFLSFMLEDKEKLLPDGHPVVMELENPRGKIVSRMVLPSYQAHHYAFKTKTEISAPTGTYTARVTVGDNVFTKSLPIETIKPNRLKINVDLEDEVITSADPTLRGKLSARWLHGAIAKNMDAKIEAKLYAVSTTFDKYENFDFDDEARSFSAESKEVFTGKLDENGETSLSSSIQPDFEAPGKLMAQLKTTVTEKGGNSSIDIFKVPYYQYENYVGIRTPEGNRGWLQTDTTHELGLVILDTDGKPVKDSRSLEIQLWKVDWRWWWDRSSGNNLSNYVYSRYRRPIMDERTRVENGKGSFDLKIDRPNWGRYYLKVHDPVSGHSTGAIIYVSWPYWAGKPTDQSGISVLEFSADKESYEVGQKAKVQIPATPQGRALVSVENGSKVVEQFWVETNEGGSEFKFNITPEMAPNVYVNISMLQPYANASNDLPIRLYGITSIGVVDPKTRLQPQINMPEVLEPDQEFSLEVSEENGQEMTYTIAVVDEGLLDITRFKTPQPWDHFYAKEALGVSTFDMYKYVVGARNGELSNVLGIGGDLDGKAGEESELNRFEPVSMFLGPFKLQAGAKTVHKIKMPYYVGSVRTMVVAREKSAYGNAEKATPVRKPLMVLATLPRVLSPNEEVLLPVSAFAMEKNIKKATVLVESNDLVEVIGASQQEIRFAEMGEEMAFFRLKVRKRIGIAEVSITATSGSETAKDQIKLQVRAPNPPVSTVYEELLSSNGSLDIDFKTIGVEGTNKGVIEVSSIPPLSLEKSIDYLIRYPHGCVEQTTSSVFAQLYLDQMMDLTNSQKARIEENVKAGINRLMSMQTSDGGFGYWPGALTSSEWGSNYAGHFLTEAQNKGYDVSRSAMKDWLRFQKRLSDDYTALHKGQYHYYRYTNGLNQAYRLYTMALAGKPNLGAMNRLKSQGDNCLTAQWRLAAAYAMAGQDQVAGGMIQGKDIIPSSYKQLSRTYGTDLRDKAMILETLVELEETLQAAKLLKSISEQLKSQRWWSTQTTAYCLIGASKYAAMNRAENPIHFSYSYGSGASKEASTGMSIAKIKMSEEELQSGVVHINNKQSGTYYVQVTTIGQPLQGDSTNSSSDLSMEIVYTDLDNTPIDVKSLPQGTTFRASVTITNPGLRGVYEEMALTQMFPSGWEIVNTRLEGTDDLYQDDVPEYRDIRDDRVLTYFDIVERQSLTYNVILTASYAGTFYQPTVTCDAMYDHSINARVAGQWVKVVSEYVN